MTVSASERRAVVTGLGVISAFGNDLESFSAGLAASRQVVAPFESLPREDFPVTVGAEAREFTGHIDNFGELPKDKKKAIRKGLKVMCREIQMGVAAAQHALHHAGWAEGGYAPDRTGMVFGSDYILTTPDEFESAVRACLDEHGDFVYDRWAEHAIPKVAPLWLLKYLPNMPASHIAIYNDMRGPSNSLTVREASSPLSIAEAAMTITRGHADVMLAGSTGTRVHPLRTVHIVMQEEVARGHSPDEVVSRPFDARRRGMVLGEGAAVIVLEELESARARGANILAEVVGAGSATAWTPTRECDAATALERALRSALHSAQLAPGDIGHYQAQGLSTKRGDEAEAAACRRVFGDRQPPLTAVSGCLGNPGAAVGMFQTVAGILSLQSGSMFPLANFEEADSACPIQPATQDSPAGDTFASASITPSGQAAAVVLRRFA